MKVEKLRPDLYGYKNNCNEPKLPQNIQFKNSFFKKSLRTNDFNKNQKKGDIVHSFVIKDILHKIDFYSHNFDLIPPIIGFIIANRFGITLTVIEYLNNEKYSPIKSYLTKNDKNIFEIDLISMYFSSFRAFATQNNIQNLSNLEISGSNIKINIFFYNKYMLIAFLNTNTKLNLKIQKEIKDYFIKEIFEKYSIAFEDNNYNRPFGKAKLKIVQNKGRYFLKKFNKEYIEIYQKQYKEIDSKIDLFMEKCNPIFRKTIDAYFEHIPKFVLNDFSRSLKEQIHNELFFYFE